EPPGLAGVGVRGASQPALAEPVGVDSGVGKAWQDGAVLAPPVLSSPVRRTFLWLCSFGGVGCSYIGAGDHRYRPGCVGARQADLRRSRGVGLSLLEGITGVARVSTQHDRPPIDDQSAD